MQRSGERNFQTERMATARAPRYSMPGLLKRKQGGHCGWSRVGGVGSGKLESWEGARSHRALQAMVKPLDFTLSEMESITGRGGRSLSQRVFQSLSPLEPADLSFHTVHWLQR